MSIFQAATIMQIGVDLAHEPCFNFGVDIVHLVSLVLWPGNLILAGLWGSAIIITEPNSANKSKKNAKKSSNDKLSQSKIGKE